MNAVSTISSGAVQDTSEKKKKEKVWMIAFAAGLLAMIAVMITTSAYANDLPGKIVKAVNGVYENIRTIATPIAGLSFVIALLISFLSHNQRAVDASRQTAKGILITWIVIMIAGAIFSYANTVINGMSTEKLPTISTTTNQGT